MVSLIPSAQTAPVYQLKVTLLDSRPKIWRRFCVPANIRLSQLHKVLQRVMGWTDSHLHNFRHGHNVYQVPYPGFDDLDGPEGRNRDERRFTLASLIDSPRQKLLYEYDFGDGWEHEVVLEKILAAAPSQNPICLGGENACPPEDSGGLIGYYRLIEILDDPKDPEHADLRDWIGGPFDPKAFDLAGVNRAIKVIKP